MKYREDNKTKQKTDITLLPFVESKLFHMSLLIQRNKLHMHENSQRYGLWNHSISDTLYIYFFHFKSVVSRHSTSAVDFEILRYCRKNCPWNQYTLFQNGRHFSILLFTC